MKITKKVFLAILGGCNILMTLFTPIAIAILWTLHVGSTSFSSITLIAVALLSSLFRGIKMNMKK